MILAGVAALSYGTLVATVAQPMPGKGPAANQGSVGTIEFSKFLGTVVVNSQGKKLGQIKDLVLDPRTGQATFAIIDAGLSSSKRAALVVPYGALRLGFQASKNRDVAVLNLGS
jgi:sporulation protein YlmC with PRC-barrel domain